MTVTMKGVNVGIDVNVHRVDRYSAVALRRLSVYRKNFHYYLEV